ncbi:hypothetical protein [Dysgonomonas sp.]
MKQANLKQKQKRKRDKQAVINVLMLAAIFIISIEMQAQVTIGALDGPEATLDIRSANPAIPTAIDGILVPLIANFPEENPPSSPTETGNLVLLRKDAGTKEEFQSKTDGFYYWNGNEWVRLITAPSSEVMEKIYCVYGQELGNIGSAPYGNETQVFFKELVYNNASELTENKFTLNNNELMVGKSGTYLVSLLINYSRGPAPGGSGKNAANCEGQTDFSAEVKVNGASKSPAIKAITNTSSEAVSGSQVLVSAITPLVKGDKLTAYVKQTSTDCNYPYRTEGINSLTLYYLHK